MYRVFLKHVAVLAVASTIVSNAHAVEVYLFKGAGDFSFVNDNLHFSRGLNQIADTLNAEGIHAEVRRFSAVEDALSTIRQRKPESVAFIGHSMGALASMAMARNLQGEGVKIVYMGLIDIPGPVGVAGDNVEWVENYYSINPVYGKLTNVSSHPNAKNIHVSGYIHNRMDDAPKVQNGMLAAIRQIHAAETQSQSPQQPETWHVQAPQPAIQPDYARSQVQAENAPNTLQTQVQVYEPPQPSGPVPVITNSSTQAYHNQSQVVQPYALPSVGVGGNPQALPQSGDPLLSQSQQFEQPQPIDPVTTSTVRKPNLLDRGRSILDRAGSLVRRFKEKRNERANAFAPQPER
ncbi:MAG: thioesterase domain-containing protein [Pseudomonadota bacterium]